MNNKPLVFFASLMTLALVIVVYYQIETNPFKNMQVAQSQQGADPHEASTGMAIYTQNCARCHGGFGEGIGKNPPLQGTRLDHGQIHEIVRTGRGTMPSFSDLSDQQIHQLVLFVEKF